MVVSAARASGAPLIGGRSNTVARSLSRGNTRSRQSRIAVISPALALSIAMRMMVSASLWKIASARIVALLREPGGRPAGFPLWPFWYIICSLHICCVGHEKPRRGFPGRGLNRLAHEKADRGQARD